MVSEVLLLSFCQMCTAYIEINPIDILGSKMESNTSELNSMDELLKMEYNALKDEKLKLIEMRQHVVEITLTLASAFLGIAFIKEAPPAIAMIYPPIAVFLAIGWVQLDYRINTLSNFIRLRIEKYYRCICFETWAYEGKRELEHKQGKIWRYVTISHYGVFIFSQLFATLIGVFMISTSAKTIISSSNLNLLIVLFIIDIFSIIATTIIFIKAEYKN